MVTGTIVTLATMPAVLAMVNLLKRAGIGGVWAAVVAVVCGVGFALADYFFTGAAWYQHAVDGLILGLGAAGLYDMRSQPYTLDTAAGK